MYVKVFYALWIVCVIWIWNVVQESQLLRNGRKIDSNGDERWQMSYVHALRNIQFIETKNNNKNETRKTARTTAVATPPKRKKRFMGEEVIAIISINGSATNKNGLYTPNKYNGHRSSHIWIYMCTCVCVRESILWEPKRHQNDRFYGNVNCSRQWLSMFRLISKVAGW